MIGIHDIYPCIPVLLTSQLNDIDSLKICWSAGSLVFSLAVSVKMNILLYAPALLIAYITVLGYTHTIIQVIMISGKDP